MLFVPTLYLSMCVLSIFMVDVFPNLIQIQSFMLNMIVAFEYLVVAAAAVGEHRPEALVVLILMLPTLWCLEVAG
jgi:hypothetical protein